MANGIQMSGMLIQKRQQKFSFNIQVQMIATRARKKLRGLGEVHICRLCGEQKETLQHLLSGSKKLVATEYVRRHNNALKIMAAEREKKEGFLPQKTRWYNEKWEKGQIMEKDGNQIFCNWEHKMRTHCKAR